MAMTIYSENFLVIGGWLFFGFVLYFWTVYLCGIPLIALLQKVVRQKENRCAHSDIAVSVLIPAHNMESEIQECLAAIRQSEIDRAMLTVIVLDDHSDDATSLIATEFGAVVFHRNEGVPGKTYALDWAISNRLCKTSFDVLVVVDATARIGKKSLEFLIDRVRAGDDVVIAAAELDQVRVKWFARGTGLALVHRNLQNCSRERLLLSCFVSGRAMAFSRRYIDKFGWKLAAPQNAALLRHPTEDWRHGLNIALAGLRVAFEPNAQVFTPLRDTFSGTVKQSLRWERGRLFNTLSLGLASIKKALAEKSSRKMCAALDSVQPSFALLFLFAVIFAAFSEVVLNSNASLFSWLPIAILLVYASCVAFLGIYRGLSVLTLVALPLYLIIRLMTSLFGFGYIIRDIFIRCVNRQR